MYLVQVGLHIRNPSWTRSSFLFPVGNPLIPASTSLEHLMIENFRGILALRLWVLYRSDPGSSGVKNLEMVFFSCWFQVLFLRRVQFSLSVVPESLAI
jgi:hypothetical protein